MLRQNILLRFRHIYAFFNRYGEKYENRNGEAKHFLPEI
jgi:hypothetical protein